MNHCWFLSLAHSTCAQHKIRLLFMSSRFFDQLFSLCRPLSASYQVGSRKSVAQIGLGKHELPGDRACVNSWHHCEEETSQSEERKGNSEQVYRIESDQNEVHRAVKRMEKQAEDALREGAMCPVRWLQALQGCRVLTSVGH